MYLYKVIDTKRKYERKICITETSYSEEKI